MWTCWYLFGFVMISTNRWFSFVSDKNNYIHAFLGWSIACMMVFDVSEIVSQDGIKFKSGHRNFAWSMIFSTLGWTISGVVAFMARKLLKWDTRTIQYIRYTHRIIALTFWCISIYTMYLGMLLYLEVFATYNSYQRFRWFADFSFAT